MVLIPWVRYLETLIDSGIWSIVIKKLEDASFIDSKASANEILEKLRNLEHNELADAVNGPSYKTIWSKPKKI